MQDIGEVKYENGTMIPWAFSQKLFAEFVDKLERTTTWKYSGNAELIFLDSNVDFSKALVMHIDTMVRDGGIGNSAELFEAIIRYCRNAAGNVNAYNFSDIQGVRVIGKTAIESLLSLLPTPAQGIWKKGQHYAVRNIAV
ncbi:MAG TPA: hypothetical protein DDY32_12785 [Desulfobulbaceae bacterium]|nr:hypothetical protein [Desulfobulbaceae bacterium]